MTKSGAASVIYQGNIIIAEFMGYLFKDDASSLYPDGYFILIDNPNRNEKFDIEYTMSMVEYHKSWNWLMPVVEKISRTKCIWTNAIAEETDTYYPRTFGMLNPETKKPMVRFNSSHVFEAPTLIEATWLAVVDFVKEYKELKNGRI